MIKALDQKEQLLLLQNNYVGNLGYIDKNGPYVIPITYFYNQEERNIICYSGPGHKITALRRNSGVSLSVSDISSMHSWKSILVHGKYKEEFGSTARALLHQFSLGVKELILKKEMRDLDFISQFSSRICHDDLPVVFTIQIDEITGRMRKY